MQKQALARNNSRQMNSEYTIRKEPFFAPVLNEQFWQKCRDFSSENHSAPDMSIIQSCVAISIHKIRRMQGARENLEEGLLTFNTTYLSSQRPHSFWTQVEKIHLFTLRLLLQNKHQVAEAYSQLDGPRDYSAVENYLHRNARVFDFA